MNAKSLKNSAINATVLDVTLVRWMQRYQPRTFEEKVDFLAFSASF